MKIELIESINLQDEFEKIFYSDKSRRINRRNFFKFCAAGSIGIVLPATITNTAHADGIASILRLATRGMVKGMVSQLLKARIMRFDVTTKEIYSNTPTSGEIYFANDSNKKSKGDLKLTLVDEWDYEEFSSMKAGFSIPPNTVQKYGFRHGPSAVVRHDTNTHLLAQTKINNKKSGAILIRA